MRWFFHPPPPSAGLDDGQLQTVARALPSTGTMELQRLLEHFAKSRSPEVGEHLVAALEKSRVTAALQTETLTKQLAGFGERIQAQAEPLLKRLEKEKSGKTERLNAILPLTKQGDIRRAQRVFHSAKAACIACHQMGYVGGRIGPDLTRIGRIRTERDLLEAVVFPSLSFVRSFEPVNIVTVAGRVYNGVIRDETSTTLTLQLDAQKVVEIPQDEIEERRASRVSIMPAGLDKQFTSQELADLVVFLKAAK